MKTRRCLAACPLAVLVLLLSAPVQAQRAQTVEGVEMALEGDMTGVRGGTLRWLITAYEVLGLSDLRPAADARIHVATSLGQTDDAAEVRTDAYGRALAEIAIPDDAPNAFRVVLRLVSQGGVQRRFELSVRVANAEAFEIHLGRDVVQPNGPIRAFGRAFHPRSRRPLARSVVHLTLRDPNGRPLDSAHETTTDEAGLFAAVFHVPEDVRGRIAVEVRNDDDEHRAAASAYANVIEPSPAALLVAVAPEGPALVGPGNLVPINVIVRSPMGRPIPGTTVTLPGAARDDRLRRAVTDARGHARLQFRAPSMSSGVRDIGVSVQANREGWGTGTGSVTLRVAADSLAAALAVEGGAIAPAIGGRVWVRVVGADGAPAGSGIEVRVHGPRLRAAGVTAQTDRDGIATLDLTLPRTASATGDRCGGQAATAIDLRVGTGTAESRSALCIPLDPDSSARVRVDHPIVRTGASIEVSIQRSPSAARAPVELTVLSTDSFGPTAIASRMVGPTQSTASIDLPDDISGLIWVRARPLIGSAREVVRGGVAAVWVVPSAAATVGAALAPDGSTRVTLGGADEMRSAVVLALPIDDARQRENTIQQRMLGPFGDLRTDPGSATEAHLFAALTVRTLADIGAPAVLRGRTVVPAPAPENPAQVGLLRDPWRSRARFVTGRLALIVRALENYIGSALPERVDDVAVTGARGFTFNGQILESVAATGTLGPAGATGLGGEPLTIEQLQRFDPSLTYNNVARRITRRRLFRLILALRSFAQARGFDLPWSRLGDPSQWMRQLNGQAIQGVGNVSQRDLVDGWGRPFELRAARGGRSRFSFVDPLGAWEIVSSGADRRFGTGDDQWDPTARILRSGTPYADAVGEDVLVARLDGVELGRASVELLQQVEPRANTGHIPPQSGAPGRRVASQLWNRIPSLFEPPQEPLALRRPARPGHGAGGAIHRLGPTGGEVTLELDEEPRTWGALVYAFTDSGWGGVAVGSALAGAPVIVETTVPEHVVAGEPVELDVVVTNVSDRPLSLQARLSGESFEDSGALNLAAGAAESIVLRLSPDDRIGTGTIALALTENSSPVRSLSWPLRRIGLGHPLRLRSAGLVRDRAWRVRFDVPGDAVRATGRVVVLRPSALAGDPDLADIRERDPALIAFSDALAARRSDPELWARLLRRQGANGAVEGDLAPLSTACAAVAWASAGEHDDDARRALAQLRAGISQNSWMVNTDVASQAATLGALSAGGVPRVLDAATRRTDPLASVAAELRTRLRSMLRTYRAEPTYLARAAAALLLADPRDTYGLAMMERALSGATEVSDGGLLVTPSENDDSPLSSLTATFALSVALHQVGRDEESGRLLRGALSRTHVTIRAGGEHLFWMLAAGTYGALGTDANAVRVTIDGQTQELALDETGRQVAVLRPSSGAHEVSVETDGGSAFVRVEAVMERPFVSRTAGPLELALDGDVGDAASLAALELTVSASALVVRPVVELQLPAGVTADARLRQAIESSGAVTRIERRAGGFVRIHLGSMNEGTSHAIPLPLRWTVRGQLHGLGAVAYPMDRPEAMSVLAPRELLIRERPVRE